MNDTEDSGLLSSTTTKASAALTVEDVMGLFEALRDDARAQPYFWYVSPTTKRLLWRMEQISKLLAKNPPAPRLLRKHARRKYQAKLKRGRARIRHQEQDGQWCRPPRSTQIVTANVEYTGYAEMPSSLLEAFACNDQVECIDEERGLWQHTITPRKDVIHGQ